MSGSLKEKRKIGNTKTANMIYEFNGYKPVIHATSFVHKEATIIGNVIIGKHVYIGPGASLRGDWGQITI